MSLYYEADGIRLFHGDCLTDHREWLEADVLVTDPPYGISYESNRNRDKRNKKKGRPIAADGSTSARDSVLNAWIGPVVMFGRWDVPRPTGVHTRLIWDKGNTVGMGNLSIPWGRSDEEIYVIGTGFEGKREGSVIRVQMLMSGDSERPDHPTPKPVPLMERLILKTVGTIADPFAGSGSTLVAARNLGRKAIGVELEERYAEICAKRLAQGALDFGDAS